MDVSTTATTMTATKPEDLQNPSPIISPRVDENLNKPQIQINTRSEHLSNPYPTTFVQADTSTFKQVVQMLTGSAETTAAKQESPSTPPPGNNKGSFSSIPPIKKTNSFKLYERRQHNNNNNNNNNNMFVKNSLMINTLKINGPHQRFMFSGGNRHSPRFSPRNSEILLSPSMLEFPKLGLKSPVTPFNNDDLFNKSSPLSLGNWSSCSPELEEKAISEKGFCLHPSSISTPKDSEPQLLPLFPLTSTKLSSGSSS